MDIGNLMKTLGGFKNQMEQVRERMTRMNITGESGAGMVRVSLNGEGTVTNISIDPELLKPEEKDMLEELIIGAFNDALQKSREALAHEMKNMTGGLNIPGMEKFFGL